LYGIAFAEQRATVKGVVERDDRMAAGDGAGDLDGVLDGLGARVHEEGSALEVAGHELVQALRQLDVALVRRHLEARVGEARRLLGNRRGHERSARADIEDSDAGAEVDERIAVHIDDDAAAGALGKDGHRAADGGRHGRLPTLHEGPRTRPGNFGDELSSLGDSGVVHDRAPLSRLAESVVRKHIGNGFH
jgi:hypothetical protein